MPDATPPQIAAIAAIHDPQRRALYSYISRSAEPVSRDSAAAALDIPRSTAAFHLDRLVADGLLEIQFRRLSGKSGPGAGRPAKLYVRAEAEITVSLPPRRYELAGELLATAIEASDQTGDSIRDSLSAVAEQTGRQIGEAAGSLDAGLERSGYQPIVGDDGVLTLGNCPFRQLATRHSEVICHTNLALLGGMAEGAGEQRERVEFCAPVDGACCARIRPAEDTPQLP